MKQLRILVLRLRSILILSVLIFGQAVLPITPFLQKAYAAPVCVSDTAGANDEPGQKDLTRLCQEASPPSGTEQVTWGWDDTGTSGNNTMDACGLFDDNDADVNTDYSICVITENSPATLLDVVIYSCGNDKNDRCTQPIDALPEPYETVCTVDQQNTDPFPAGDFNPVDTVATCTFDLDDLNALNVGDLTLTDVCSYPSQQPNSDPSDCVIIQNEPVAVIEVIKDIVPNGDTGLFNLTVNGPGNNDTTTVNDRGDNGTTGMVSVTPPTNGSANATVSETAGTNTNLANYSSSITCANRNGGAVVVPPTTGTSVQVPVSDGSNIICTITNTKAGSITIIKDAKPNRAQDFHFTTTGTGLTDFDLDDDSNATLSNSKTFNNLNAGDYTITEAAVSGWDLKSLVCSGGTTQVNGSAVTITLTAGQNVTCTFTNVKRATVTVNKITDPASDPTTFPITISGTGNIAGNTNRDLTTSQSVVYDVSEGVYSVSEQVPTGWAQTGNTCTENNLTIAVTNSTTDAELAKTCTITNTKLAKLKIVKDAIPNDEQDFVFTALGAGLSGFTLDDDTDLTNSNEQQFVSLMPGSYSVTEQSTPGWSLTNLTCNTNNYAVNGNTVNVNLGAGQETACTYENTKLGSISGIKYTANADGSLGPVLSGWTIFIDSNNDGVLDQNEQSTTTDQNGTYSFLDLLPGNYILKEVLMSGWTQIFGTNPVELDAGENSTDNNFGNFENGSIGGFKWNDKDADAVVDNDESKLSGWGIKLYDSQNNVLATTTTDGSGNYSFTNLTPGTYGVCETQQSNWMQTFPANNSCHTIVIDISGETNEANFGNQGRGNIQVIKNVDTDGDGNIDVQGATDWTWDIDGLGNFATGSTQNVAAGTYTVSEDQKSGYHVTSVVCDTQVTAVSESAQIVVAVGATVICTFTNTRDTGTITVNKVVNPTNDNGLFDLQISGTTYANDVGDGGTTGAVQLPTGDYDVSEVAGTGTDLDDYSSSLSCSNGQTGTTSSGTFTLSTSDNVVCTFTNTRYGHIIVEKQTLPNGSSQTFHFDASYDQDGFDLSDGQTNNSGNLLPGNYSVSEDTPGGWDLTSAICDGRQNNPSSISLSAGETITCVFTNTQRGSISGTKFKVDAYATDGTNGTPLSGWLIFIDSNDNGEFDLGEALDVTDVLGNYEFVNLQPDDYVICEVLQNGWTQIFPTGKPGCHDVTVDPGEADEGNDFGNFLNGSISGYKFEDIDGDGVHDVDEPKLSDWEIVLKEGVDIVDTVFTDVEGNFEFTNLSPGTYTVCEELQTNWVQTTDPVCYTIVINVSGETNPETIFGNQGRGTITVIKEVVSIQEDDGLFNLNVNDVTEAQNVGDGGTTGSVTLPVGTHSVSETAGTETDLDDYNTTYSCIDDNESEIASGVGTEVTGLDLGLGENISCVFTNTRKANITVIKDADPDNPQDFDFDLCNLTYNGEEYIPDVCGGFSLDDDDDPTLPNGRTAQVSPGLYQITEDAVTNWILSHVVCGGEGLEYEPEDNGAYLFVPAGANIVCVLTNTVQEVALNIEKSNDSPNPVNLASTVTYTLTVSVPETSGTAYDVKVNDLPSENFEYVSGSWTAVSSVRGDLKAEGPTTEPTYASPGLWLLGNMIPGEVVTLTYKVVVGSNVTAGVYPDVAFAVAKSLPVGGSQVLSNVSTGADTPFVGTRVTVTTPQVLGATVLAETGSPLALQYAFTAILTIFTALQTTRVRRQAKGGRA